MADYRRADEEKLERMKPIPANLSLALTQQLFPPGSVAKP
jgi:hypothetical protein